MGAGSGAGDLMDSGGLLGNLFFFISTTVTYLGNNPRYYGGHMNLFQQDKRFVTLNMWTGPDHEIFLSLK